MNRPAPVVSQADWLLTVCCFLSSSFQSLASRLALQCPSCFLNVSCCGFLSSSWRGEFVRVAWWQDWSAEGCLSPPGRTWPVSLGSGLGLGMGCANCQYDFKSFSLFQPGMVQVSAAEVCCLFGQNNKSVISVYLAGPNCKQVKRRRTVRGVLVCYVPVVLQRNFCPGADVHRCPGDVCENAAGVYLIKPLWKTGSLLSLSLCVFEKNEMWSGPGR